MATTPQFTSTPHIGMAAVTNVETDVFTGAANGSRVDVIDLKAQGATTAGTLQLYLLVGALDYLWMEIDITAIGAGHTFEAEYSPTNGLVLANGNKIRAMTSGAGVGTINVIVRGSDF